MVVFIIPVYAMILKDRKDHRAAEAKRLTAETEATNTRQNKYMEREQQIIAVVTANTEVMASLKSTLERDGKETKTTIERVHTRIDEQGKTLVEQGGAIVKLQSTLDEVIRKQQAVSDDIKRGFSEIRQKYERGEAV
jgi:hypothetical protein